MGVAWPGSPTAWLRHFVFLAALKKPVKLNPARMRFTSDDDANAAAGGGGDDHDDDDDDK